MYFDLREWPGFVQAGGDPSRPAQIDQVVTDSRRVNSSHTLFVALPGEKTDGHQFLPEAVQRGAGYLLVKKGCSFSHLSSQTTAAVLQVEDPLQALQAIARSYRQKLKTKIVALIGSYGKTMVKDLLKELLDPVKSVAVSPESFNSQLGVPLSLLTIQPHHEFALIEAGISQKLEMDRLTELIIPDHVVLTHVGKKHLATLDSQQGIAAEMTKMVEKVPSAGWVLLPDTPLLQPYLNKFKASIHFWNLSGHLPHATAEHVSYGAPIAYQIHYLDGLQQSLTAPRGFHYFLDLVNIAIKAAWLLGVPAHIIAEVLKNYHAEPMRTEIWRSPQGITLINDPYCSDPQSIGRALRHLQQTGYKGRKLFLFGGLRGEPLHIQSSYRQIGELIHCSGIDKLFLTGSCPYEPLIAELNRLHSSVEIISCPSQEAGLHLLNREGQSGDIVLVKGARKIPLEWITEIFNGSLCNNVCFINVAAIEANLATIRKRLSGTTRIMVMIKALAYGTNDIRMGHFLANCGIDILGVSTADEGLALKRSGITQSLFVINAVHYEAKKIAQWDLEVAVSERSLIAALASEACEQNKKLKVHLHVDTGMGRFGCRLGEAVSLAEYICSFPSLKLEGLMTHFACAEDPTQDEFTQSQIRAFTGVIEAIKAKGIHIPWIHAANSGAIMRFEIPHCNMVRLGLAVYGLYPSEYTKEALDLRLALSLVSRIVGINTCQAGESISYGRAYTVKGDGQRFAVLPLGYFDGLHRNYSGKAAVLIRGKKAPMVGKICMDFMMVDITDIPEAAIGDPVLIFGEDEYGQYLSPEEFASKGDSIIHELMTCLGPRIHRVFIHEESRQLR